MKKTNKSSKTNRWFWAAVSIALIGFAFTSCPEPEPPGENNIINLPPMKEQFSAYFMIGNIFNPGDAPSASGISTATLTRHFNVLTAENDMKPDKIAPSRNASTGTITYTYATADRMVNAAIASNIKVVGHTLLWHQQNAGWMNQLPVHNNNQATKDANIAIMKKYITEVVDHFKGRIYSWDVLNEVFSGGGIDWKTAMRSGNGGNPWFNAIGSDFVYEGFLAARLADPNAILYYNDFNLNEIGKATMVRDMVKAVNDKYLASSDKPAGEATDRLLIEGIGMQSHHNTGVQASAIRITLNLFRPLGVIISISELDVLGQTYQQFSSNPKTAPNSGGTNKHTQTTVTADGLATQANLYRQYMALFIEYSDIIERVTLWGVRDDQSWRSAGLPLLFDARGNAKAAYHSFVGALP